MTKCLAFDLGRVVFDFEYETALEKMTGRIDASRDQVMESLFYSDFGRDFEKGLISSREFYEKFRRAFRVLVDFDEFIRIWCGIFRPNREVIDLIMRLKKNYPVYMISNITELHFDYLYEKYAAVFSLFDGLILSYRVKSVKPEKEIYDRLVEMSGRDPADTVYIDDRSDLIEAATALGFVSRQFSGYENLLGDLKALQISFCEK